MGTILATVGTLFAALLGTAGILGLLQFFNTRKSVRKKTDAEAQTVFDDMMEKRLKNAYDRIEALEQKDFLRQVKEEQYADLFWDMMQYIEDNVPHKDELRLAEFHSKITSIRRLNTFSQP